MNILAPDKTVNIPKKICNKIIKNKNIVIFLRWAKFLFLNIINAINKNRKNIE